MVGWLDGRRHLGRAFARRKGTAVKNNGLQKADYAGQINTALALIRKGHGVTRSPAPEIFHLYCYCAVEDKPYTLRFVRQSSGLLRFKESIKGKPASFPNNARAGGVGYTLRMEYFENSATPCAWCGNGGFHHCANDCGALVCGGRMKGDTFHCRKSCGASWVGVPLQEVKGNVTREPSPLRASLSPAPRPAPGPAKPMLLLPAGRERRGGSGGT